MKNTSTVYLILALLVAIHLPVPAFAQSVTSYSVTRSGSIYSALGVGFPVDNTSAGFRSQGLLGITSLNSETSGIANPALWGYTYFTQAGTGLQMTRAAVEGSGATATNINLQTGYLHLLFPLSPGRVGLSVGLFPVTRSTFKSTTSHSFIAGQDVEIDYSNRIQTIGGINKFEFGIGIRLNKNISLGYAPSIAFLSMRSTEDLTFSVSGFQPFNQTNYINGATVSHRFGLTASFNNLLASSDRLSFGATLNLPYTLEANQQLTSLKYIDGVLEEIDFTDELSTTKGDISMPLEMAFGLGYAPNTFLSFASEIQLQNWGDFSNNLDPEAAEIMTNRTKVGFGGQYLPYRRGYNSFLSRFKYSAGVSYDSGHLTIENQDINTLWLNAGIGILSRSTSFIDISVQYGLRGTTSNNLFEERIWAIGFSVNLAERMFVRPKLR